MAEWAPSPGGRVIQFSSYTNGDGVVNGSASANTKGGYELLVSSLANDIEGLFINFPLQSTTVRDYLLDLAIGAAAAEQIILPNLLGSGTTFGGFEMPRYFFPIHIPAGTRLSARLQSSTGSGSAEVFMHGIVGNNDADAGCSRVEACGVNTADSGATSIDPGGTAGVYGSYSQLIASTAFDYKWVIVAFGNQANAARTAMAGDLDLAIGAGGSEQIILTGLRFFSHSTPDQTYPFSLGPFPVAIPAGSRLAARCVNYSVTTSPARLIDCAVYGIG